MILTKEKSEEFDEVAKPLIKWLNENCNPHTCVIVDNTTAELLSGAHSCVTTEFLKD